MLTKLKIKINFLNQKVIFITTNLKANGEILNIFSMYLVIYL